MSTSPILKNTLLANQQVNQFATANESLEGSESASDGLFVVDLSAADAIITNTISDDYQMLRAHCFKAANNSVARSITFSPNQRNFKVLNSGTSPVDVVIGATVISVAAAAMASFYADGTVNGLYSIEGGGGPSSDELTVRTEVSSFTVATSDSANYIQVNNAGAVNVTIPTNAADPIPQGAVIIVEQTGAGQITVVASGGVTANTPETLKSRKQFSVVSMTKTSTDTWTISGDLEAVV